MEGLVKRIGLTAVYTPGDGESHEVDIVLVHGLFGHPKKTWTGTFEGSHTDDVPEGFDESEEPVRKKPRFGHTNAKREVFWPRDLLPKFFPKSRVLTWGYDVQIEQMLSSTSNASILHHAETLLSDLATLRSSALDKVKPLIFIAHSLGSIVVKDALSLSWNETTYFNEILPATTGVMFLGTPHHGSKIASLGKLAFELSRIFFQKPNVEILRGLEKNSQILERITRSFGQLLAAGTVKVHSVREELDTKGIRIVDPLSSTIGYLHETRGSLHANHRDMAKFSSVDDVKFQRVQFILNRWIEEVPKSRPLAEVSRIPDGLIFDEQYQECLKSLDFMEARKRAQDIEAEFEKTYDWLFDRQISFCDWLEGKHTSTTYWIQGKPGSGKSTAMKFILNHPSTLELLETYDSGSWVIAGYFFHDRGTMIQKSVEGFLGEILYQILHQRKELFPPIYPVFCQLYKMHGPDCLVGSWSISAFEKALLSIASKSESDVNICLFVDALDEHDGNHRELLSILSRLTQLTENPYFRLRLCLAGRPENIFKDAFHTCPGFAIHNFTTGDIRLYSERRIQMEMRNRFTQEGEQELHGLIEHIIEKAQGVFMWVRLVVDELIEGLCEGDSIEELKDLLSSIPTELEELYTRALRRKPRTSSLALGKHRYEAYVMFQIAICCRDPFKLYQFLATALFLTTGRGTYPDLQTL